MTEISIPDDAVQRAFAEALEMPADTGSTVSVRRTTTFPKIAA